MSDAIFNKIADEYIPNLKDDEKTLGYPPTVILHKDGEPLLHPRLEEYLLKIADTKPKFRINLYTNGMNLTDEFFEFLASLPNESWVFISFHFFDFNGKENNYTRTTEVVKRAIRKEYNNLHIVMTSHVNKYCSEDYLKTWADSWLPLKMERKRFDIGLNKNINPWTDLIHEENLVKFTCCPYQDFGHLFIGATGNVIPCCMDLEEDLSIGNIMDTPREDLMVKMQDFYNKLQQGEYPQLCKYCLGVEKR